MIGRAPGFGERSVFTLCWLRASHVVQINSSPYIQNMRTKVCTYQGREQTLFQSIRGRIHQRRSLYIGIERQLSLHTRIYIALGKCACRTCVLQGTLIALYLSFPLANALQPKAAMQEVGVMTMCVVRSASCDCGVVYRNMSTVWPSMHMILRSCVEIVYRISLKCEISAHHRFDSCPA